MDLHKLLPQRIKILYLILGVLIVVAVVPLYFYGTQVVEINRERLITNERVLQNTVTRSLADEIVQRQTGLRISLDNLASAIQVASGNNLTGDHVATPELRALLDSFVSKSDMVVYATILNAEAKGITAGRIAPDPFMQRELEHGFQAARENRPYFGQALTVGTGKGAKTIRLVSAPMTIDGNFIGMIGAVVDLQFLIARLQDAGQGGLEAYVVDARGRLVASAVKGHVTGQDMTKVELVKSFVDEGDKSQIAATREFNINEEGHSVPMLGTFKQVPTLEWAVVAQKTQEDAYRSVTEMRRTANLLALLAIVVSLFVSMYAARRITEPLQVLTESSRAIARGDFSKRVRLENRTEIGELAQ